MKAFLPNAQRGKWAKISLTLTIIITLILTVSNVLQLELLTRWNNGGEVNMVEADLNDARQEIIAYVYYAIRILAVICFLLWFSRAYSNLHQKLQSLNFTEGWAVGAWFVPFINLGRPYRIMKELYTESTFWLKLKGINVQENGTQYIIPWWTFWLLIGLLGRIINKMPEETVEELIEMTQFAIGSGVMELIAGFLALKVVSDYTKREEYMMEIEKQIQLSPDSAATLSLDLNDKNSVASID